MEKKGSKVLRDITKVAAGRDGSVPDPEVSAKAKRRLAGTGVGYLDVGWQSVYRDR